MSKQAEAMKLAFEQWWSDEGSQAPKPSDDMYEHCKRMCEIAWANGAYKALEQPACKYGNEPASCRCSPMDCQCEIDAFFEQPHAEGTLAQQQEPIGKWMGNAVEWTENPYKFCKGQLIYTSPPAPAGYAKKIESLIVERDALKAKLAEQPAQQEPDPDELTIAYMSGVYEGKKIGAKEGCNKLATWMMQCGFATGHGDTLEELLYELDTEIEDRLAAIREKGGA